jgi:hypothetical protein
MSEADKIRAEGGGMLEFLRQGAVHMVTGYDHLLFLLGVVFFLNRFKDIVKFVTAFTLGHCITLIGATFLGIQANYFLIDAVIALTVCYKGFDNVGGFPKYLGVKSPNLLGMVFAFGLIHGFGLSTRLQQLTVGDGLDLLGKILAFNVGVEAGQVAALLVMLTLLAAWRHTASFQRFSIAANTGLIMVGGLLLLMQLHGYQHQATPMAFYDLQAHQHAHEDLGVGGGATPAGFHVDVPGGAPHKDHGPDGGHSHAMAQAEPYAPLVDGMFETRTALKAARASSNEEEVLAAHQPVAEILKAMTTISGMIAGSAKIDTALYAAFLADAAETARLIEKEAQGGSAEKIKELLARFDKSILGIEELLMHPGTAIDQKYLPEGYHTDENGGIPHADHDHPAAQ